jgi:molecular chaperone HtpG
VVAEHDYSPQLERLLAMGREGARQRRILELNPEHALVQQLRARFAADPNDPVVGDYAELLLGWSLLAEGSEPHDPARFTQLVAGLMEQGLEKANGMANLPTAPTEPAADAASAAAEPNSGAAEAPEAPEATASDPDASLDASEASSG